MALYICQSCGTYGREKTKCRCKSKRMPVELKLSPKGVKIGTKSYRTFLTALVGLGVRT